MRQDTRQSSFVEEKSIRYTRGIYKGDSKETFSFCDGRLSSALNFSAEILRSACICFCICLSPSPPIILSLSLLALPRGAMPRDDTCASLPHRETHLSRAPVTHVSCPLDPGHPRDTGNRGLKKGKKISPCELTLPDVVRVSPSRVSIIGPRFSKDSRHEAPSCIRGSIFNPPHGARPRCSHPPPLPSRILNNRII